MSVLVRRLDVNMQIGWTYSLRHSDGYCCEVAHARSLRIRLRRWADCSQFFVCSTLIRFDVSETAMWCSMFGERSAGSPDIIVKWSDEEVALVLVSSRI